MMPRLRAGRRAEAFARAVDQAPGPVDARDAGLLEVVADLRRVEPPVPRPDFVVGLRERLLAEAETVLIARDAETEDRLRLPEARAGRPNRRVAATVGVVALVGASTSMAVASQSTLPGDTLYPIKRALESAQTQVRFDDTDRAFTSLAIAGQRLDEAIGLAERRDPADQRSIHRLLDEFVEQTEPAAEVLFTEFDRTGQAALMERLREFLSTGMRQLTVLQPLLTADSSEALLSAARSLNDLDRRAAELCATCPGGVAEIPRSMLLAADQLDLTGPSAGSPGPAPPPGSAAAPPGLDLPDLPDLPDLTGPMTEGATGSTGVPGAAPGQPGTPHSEPGTGPATERPGDAQPDPGRPGKGKGPLGQTVDEVTKGLVGSDDPDDDPGLLPTVTDGLTATVESALGIVTGALNGLLGPKAGSTDGTDEAPPGE